MEKIILNDIERLWVMEMARNRYAYDRKLGLEATVYKDGVDNIDNEVNAYGAEVAYCKLFNLYPDLEHSYFMPFDAMHGDKSTVDVKTTVLTNGRLLVKKKERMNLPDEYALMIGSYPIYTYIGHIAAGKLIRPENLDTKLKSPAYAARQSELHKRQAYD